MHDGKKDTRAKYWAAGSVPLQCTEKTHKVHLNCGVSQASPSVCFRAYLMLGSEALARTTSLTKLESGSSEPSSRLGLDLGLVSHWIGMLTSSRLFFLHELQQVLTGTMSGMGRPLRKLEFAREAHQIWSPRVQQNPKSCGQVRWESSPTPEGLVGTVQGLAGRWKKAEKFQVSGALTVTMATIDHNTANI